MNSDIALLTPIINFQLLWFCIWHLYMLFWRCNIMVFHKKNPKADVKNRFQKNIHFKKYSNKGKRMSKDTSDETPKPFLRVEREKHEQSQESSWNPKVRLLRPKAAKMTEMEKGAPCKPDPRYAAYWHIFLICSYKNLWSHEHMNYE